MKTLMANDIQSLNNRKRNATPNHAEVARSLNRNRSPKVQINIRTKNNVIDSDNPSFEFDNQKKYTNQNIKEKRLNISKGKKRTKEDNIDPNTLFPKIHALDESTKSNLIGMLSSIVYSKPTDINMQSINSYYSNRIFSADNHYSNEGNSIDMINQNRNSDYNLVQQSPLDFQGYRKNERINSFIDLTQQLTNDMEGIKKTVQDIRTNISQRDTQLIRLLSSQREKNFSETPQSLNYQRKDQNILNNFEINRNYRSSGLNKVKENNHLEYESPQSKLDFYVKELEKKDKLIKHFESQNYELNSKYTNLLNNNQKIIDLQTPQKDQTEPNIISSYPANLIFKQENSSPNTKAKATKQHFINENEQDDTLDNYIRELEKKLNETLKLNEELVTKNAQSNILNDNLNIDNIKLKNENKRLNNEVIKVSNNSKTEDDQQIKEYVETINELNKTISEIKEPNNKMIVEKELEIDKLKSQIDKYINIESEFNSLQNQNRLYKLSIENMKKSNVSIIKISENSSRGLRELKELKESNESLIKVKKDLEFKLTQLIEIHKQKDEEIEKLKQEISSPHNNITQSDKPNEEITKQFDDLKEQNVKYAQKITMLEAKSKKDNEKMLQIKMESAKYLQEATDIGNELKNLKANMAKKGK